MYMYYCITPVLINISAHDHHNQCVMPFFVATAMTPFRRSNFWVADAIQFTRSAVATIGIKKFTYGNISHEIQVCDPCPLCRTTY